MKPPEGSGAQFEDDPTGVRELLRALPDPGPMPDDVTRRIQNALDAEKRSAPVVSDDDQERISRLLADQPDPGPMPDDVMASIESALAREAGARPEPTHQQQMRDLLADLPAPGPMPASVSDRIEAALQREAGDRGEAPENVTPLFGGERSSGRSSRPADRSSRDAQPRRRNWFTGVAVAAAVGAIAVAVGPNIMESNQAPPVMGAQQSSDADLADRVNLSATGTKYTSASFAEQARAMNSEASLPEAPASKLAALGSVGTKDGILKCARLLGDSLRDDPDRIRVDLADYNDRPSVIVVVTKGEKSTGWVLSRTCDTDDRPVAGPTDVS